MLLPLKLLVLALLLFNRLLRRRGRPDVPDEEEEPAIGFGSNSLPASVAMGLVDDEEVKDGKGTADSPSVAPVRTGFGEGIVWYVGDGGRE